MLDEAARLARIYVDGLAARPVGATAGAEELRARLQRPLTAGGEDPLAVIADLAADADPGSSPPPARATSASSSVARFRSPSPPTG